MSTLNEMLDKLKEQIIDELKEEGILEPDEKGYRGVEIIETATIPELENDGWIPVKERLPEIGKPVWATVKHSEWISDYNSDWVPEEKKTHHPECYGMCIRQNI